MIEFLIYMYLCLAVFAAYTMGQIPKDKETSDDEHFKSVLLAAALWPLTIAACMGYYQSSDKKPELASDLPDQHLDLKV